MDHLHPSSPSDRACTCGEYRVAMPHRKPWQSLSVLTQWGQAFFLWPCYKGTLIYWKTAGIRYTFRTWVWLKIIWKQIITFPYLKLQYLGYTLFSETPILPFIERTYHQNLDFRIQTLELTECLLLWVCVKSSGRLLVTTETHAVPFDFPISQCPPVDALMHPKLRLEMSGIW